jgi:hypothetical protein
VRRLHPDLRGWDSIGSTGISEYECVSFSIASFQRRDWTPPHGALGPDCLCPRIGISPPPSSTGRNSLH